MPRRKRIFLIAWIALLCGVFKTSSLSGQSSQPAAPDVQVREWLIVVCDPLHRHANPSTVFSTLPESLIPLRAIAQDSHREDVSPIGVIRFTGQTDQKFTVRLTTPDDGVCYASWPPAQVRSRDTIWPDLTLSRTPRRLIPTEALAWLTPLRNTEGPYVTSAGRSEKFLLYDVEFPFVLPLVLSAGKGDVDSVSIRNTGTTPLHDVVVYRPARHGNGWTRGEVSEIPLEAPAAPTTAPVLPPIIRFSAVGNDPDQFLPTDWKSRLVTSDLDPADLNLIARILKLHALDERQTTVVFRLDESALDRLLPLKITPRPARVRRLALVIARNVDPTLPELLDQLVAELGDPDWHKRETASRLLARYGSAATSRLREALRNPDPEIALRAERLLAPAMTR